MLAQPTLDLEGGSVLALSGYGGCASLVQEAAAPLPLPLQLQLPGSMPSGSGEAPQMPLVAVEPGAAMSPCSGQVQGPCHHQQQQLQQLLQCMPPAVQAQAQVQPQAQGCPGLGAPSYLALGAPFSDGSPGHISLGVAPSEPLLPAALPVPGVSSMLVL